VNNAGAQRNQTPDLIGWTPRGPEDTCEREAADSVTEDDVCIDDRRSHRRRLARRRSRHLDADDEAGWRRHQGQRVPQL